MRFSAFAVATLLVAAPCLGFADSYPAPAGRYCGKLMSSGVLADAETRFRIEPDGRLSGTYAFRDSNTVTDGRLQQIEKDSDLTKSLRWTDKYGDGRLVITFDPAFMRFDGHWGTADAVPDQLWTGRRCQEPNS